MTTRRLDSSRRALLTSALTAAAALFGALLMAAAPAHAAVDAQSFSAAFQQFQTASAAGREADIEGAAEQFTRLSAAEPADPVLLAYSGAATAMRANTTMLPWRKLSFAEEGLARLDKALALLGPEHDTLLHRGTPASVETRFVAASTFLRLPAAFNRHARGANLLNEVLKSPLLATSPVGFRAAVWLRAGDEALHEHRNDDARRWLQQVIDSGAPQASTAHAKLQEIAR